MTKIDIINKIIQKKNIKNYLEIGFAEGWTFNRIICDYKVGVDPALADNKCQKEIYKLTSNDFFKQNTTNFDLVFIDGLHLYEQVICDILNSFKFLNDNGFIVIHDCLPSSEQIAGREYKDKSLPWTGDVYKAIVWFREQHPHIPCFVLNCDWGCGIIQKTHNLNKFDVEMVDNYNQYDYNWLHKNISVLNIKSPEYLDDYLSYEEIKIGKQQMNEQEIIDNFHKLYYSKTKQTWGNTHWMGVEVHKIPMDLFIYQEILYEIKPDIIIETGTFKGGSAYYLAHICDILGKGNIITVDVNQDISRPLHPRICYLTGSSIDPVIIEKIKENINSDTIVLVILDSDHSKDHVLKELNLYDKFVTKNSYMIVEDSNVNNHPVYSTHGPGPMEAIDEFLLTNTEFVIDSSREKFMMTFSPRGYLKKTI